MKRKMTAVLGVVAATAMMPALQAFADGGHTIAAAPVVHFGTQQFGNMASGLTDNDDDCREYWTVPTTAGDKITINWESSASYRPYLSVYPVGTNDYNVDQTDAAETYGLNDNGKAQSVFQAAKNGQMPLMFFNYSECSAAAQGPFDFIAYVKHAVVGTLPALQRLRMHGTVNVGAHTPDGQSIASGLKATLQVRRGQTGWVSVGSAPVLNSVAKVGYKVPASYKGSKVKVRAVLTGKAYQRTATGAQRVRAGRVS